MEENAKKKKKTGTCECAERVNGKKKKTTLRRREMSLTVLVSFIDALLLDATTLISLK